MAKRIDQGDRPEVGLRLMLIRVAALLEAGDATWLGPEWESVLSQTLDENLGDVTSSTPIELHKLARSPKTKSGYVGVYANGKGFRAHGKDPNTFKDIYIGQAASAEAAAWKRYLHYQKHGLPYGQREQDIDTYMEKFNKDRATAERLLDEDNKGIGVEYNDGYRSLPEPKMLGFDEPVPQELLDANQAARARKRNA